MSDDNEKKGHGDDSVAFPMEELDESKAELIKSSNANNQNGGAGAGDVSVGIIDPTGSSDGDVSFNGLGKDEVLQYANVAFWVRLRWILFILFWFCWTAMLVAAIVIIALAPRCPPRPDLKWYETGAVYQVYSKSFKDSHDDAANKKPMDGFGDFKGLKDKMDYITDTMNMKALFINSIFKTEELTASPYLSDLAIIDHKMLDDRFGTNVDAFKSWMKGKRKDGFFVILDLIPNQTSKKHEWYKKAALGDVDYKDYYIWAKTAGSEKTVYGKSAWTKDDAVGEFYYHSLSADLPDLNLNNEAVREEITAIMKFWLDAGVGGFRINGLNYLVEDQSMGQATANETNGGTLEYLEELRSVVDGYNKPGRERFIFGTVTAMANDTAAFVESDGEKKAKRLNMVISEMNFNMNCKADCLIDLLQPIANEVVPWVGIQLGNENTKRIGNNLLAGGDLMIGHTLQMLLPGTPFNYYGDEFGMKGGVEAAPADMEFNPMNARTPMQWNSMEKVGFTNNDVTPWVPVGKDYQSNNVDREEGQFTGLTNLKAFQELLSLRESESFQWGSLKACSYKDVFMFTRTADGFPYFLTIINTSDGDEAVNMQSVDCVNSEKKGIVRFHSDERDVGETLDFEKAIFLRSREIAVIEFAV